MAYHKRQEALGTARRLLDESKPEDALAILSEYLEKYRQDFDANVLAGVAYAQLREPELAERHFKEALAIDERSYEVSMMLMRVLMDQFKWEDALPIAERLRLNHPNDRVVKVSLESIRENVERPAVGWERDENKPRVDVEFTEG